MSREELYRYMRVTVEKHYQEGFNETKAALKATYPFAQRGKTENYRNWVLVKRKLMREFFNGYTTNIVRSVAKNDTKYFIPKIDLYYYRNV